jgi:membrane fusion protein (multidrug efflux system)
MTVADTATLRLQGNVSQEEVMLLKVGGSVRVTVDGMGGPGYSGRIAQVGPIAAATGQYFPVVVTIANDGKLLAGMTAKAGFDIEGGPSLVVPATALLRKDGQPYVYVVSGGKAALKPVAVGIANASMAQILSGLAEGETVAVSNVSLLKDGMEVTP